MKKIALYFGALIFAGCAMAQNDNNFAPVPKVKPGQAVATLGGGCFWAMAENMSELKGVDHVVSGYAGGNTKNPTYEDVSTRTTNHAECVQVYYDPKVISYATLMKAFFFSHDPTTLNRQGPDEGTDYRSIAFYRTPEEKKTIEDLVKEVNASKHYSNPIVTQIVPFTVFYAGENYHQGYYKAHLNDNPYLTSVSEVKVMKMRKAMKPYLKPEFQK